MRAMHDGNVLYAVVLKIMVQYLKETHGSVS